MKHVNKDISEQDLRARERYRVRIDTLRGRLGMLEGRDRILMTMYWEKGSSLTQIGKLAGINRASLARRLNKITERLMEGKYIDCIRSIERFTPEQIDVAKDYYLTGLSIRKIARRRKISFYQVRKTIRNIERKIQGSQ